MLRLEKFSVRTPLASVDPHGIGKTRQEARGAAMKEPSHWPSATTKIYPLKDRQANARRESLNPHPVTITQISEKKDELGRICNWDFLGLGDDRPSCFKQSSHPLGPRRGFQPAHTLIYLVYPLACRVHEHAHSQRMLKCASPFTSKMKSSAYQAIGALDGTPTLQLDPRLIHTPQSC